MGWQLLGAAIGVALMAAPGILTLPAAVADAFHVLGPLAAACGAIAASPVLRVLRRIQLPVGLGVAVAPLVLGSDVVGIGVGLLAGLALLATAFAPGAPMDRFGGGWRALTG
ncbi:MAG TPA: hypothetical protein VFV59_07055 [Candidatus Limnocylindria bacterium]|nr:hypothetical protein [Candidatus Limnocylindria bacterium]